MHPSGTLVGHMGYCVDIHWPMRRYRIDMDVDSGLVAVHSYAGQAATQGPHEYPRRRAL